MKHMNKIAAAVALGLAGGAHALPLSDYDSTVVNVYFGGATATDNVLENVGLAITGGYCVPGTIDIYRTTTANNQRVIFCRVDGTRVPGFPAAPGARVAFHKESRGGSSNGVIPLIDVAFSRAHALQWLDLDQLRLAGGGNGCVTTAVAATAALNAYTNHANCNNLLTPVDTAASAQYDINGGISDVEPALSFPAPTPAEIARLSSRAGLGIIFGVPATTNLYTALQVAQGKTPGSISPADIPSLTSAQVRGLYTGFIADWNQITTPSGAPLPSAPGVTPPNSTEVNVCRRVASSGTQASFETYWLYQRCQGGVATFVEPNDGSSPLDTVWIPVATPPVGTVNAGPSSGNVRLCLATYGNALNNRWAVGVLSTEVSSGNLTEGNFRMIAVDGAAPTLQNTANGLYDFFTENTLNRVATGFPGALPNDLRRTLLVYVENNIGLPPLISQLNNNFQNRPWGDGGSLGIPNGATINPNPSPATNTEMDTNPVNTQTRSPLGPTNNCAPPVAFGDTPTPVGVQTLP
jgi:hypothetical protein